MTYHGMAGTDEAKTLTGFIDAWAPTLAFRATSSDENVVGFVGWLQSTLRGAEYALHDVEWFGYADHNEYGGVVGVGLVRGDREWLASYLQGASVGTDVVCESWIVRPGAVEIADFAADILNALIEDGCSVVVFSSGDLGFRRGALVGWYELESFDEGKGVFL